MKKIKRDTKRRKKCKWTLVSDRLPKEAKWYLVQWKSGYITTDFFKPYDNTFGDEDVVAWMEIPTPLVKGVLMY